MNDDQFTPPQISPVRMVLHFDEAHVEIQAHCPGVDVQLCATLARDLTVDRDIQAAFAQLATAVGAYLHLQLYPGEPVTSVFVTSSDPAKKAH